MADDLYVGIAIAFVLLCLCVLLAVLIAQRFRQRGVDEDALADEGDPAPGDDGAAEDAGRRAA
jgi:hypothetical protein